MDLLTARKLSTARISKYKDNIPCAIKDFTFKEFLKLLVRTVGKRADWNTSDLRQCAQLK